MLICLKPPPLLDFLLSINFAGSESCQVQSEKLLQNMVSNTTDTPPPPIRTYTVLIHTGKVGRGSGEPERREEGQQGEITDQKAGSRIPTWLKVRKEFGYLQSINSLYVELEKMPLITF